MFIEYSDCFLWECETCRYQVTFKPHHFYDCVDELKQRGWSFWREEDGWHHSCPRHRRTMKEWMDQVPHGAVKVVK
jgi:hypothetical protein